MKKLSSDVDAAALNVVQKHEFVQGDVLYYCQKRHWLTLGQYFNISLFTMVLAIGLFYLLEPTLMALAFLAWLYPFGYEYLVWKSEAWYVNKDGLFRSWSPVWGTSQKTELLTNDHTVTAITIPYYKWAGYGSLGYLAKGGSKITPLIPRPGQLQSRLAESQKNVHLRTEGNSAFRL